MGSGDVILYHYSREKLRRLETVAFRTKTKPKKKMDYKNHLSFFLDPLPLDMARLHEGRSEVWKSGDKWFEHKIILPANLVFAYHLVNTPVQLLTMDTTFSSYDFDKHREVEAYWANIYSVSEKEGAYSKESNAEGLWSAYERNKGTLLTAIELQVNGTHALPWQPRQHASRLPHLMLYPVGGVVEVSEVRQIKLK